ncbi:endosomal/lysosomal proton channel TMEM175-like isoform X2 [Glandiceps talaboti]
MASMSIDEEHVSDHEVEHEADDIRTIPPDSVQFARQDSNHSLTGSSRLQAYSDAIFSIIATVMILPIAHHEINEHESLYDTFGELLPLLVVYLMSFFAVSAAWAGHVWVFQTIARTDDVIVILNLGILMVVTFLPFSFTLLGLFPTYRLAIGIYCLCITFIGVLQAFTVWYAFRQEERILTPETVADPEKYKKRAALYQVLLTNPVICIVAVIVGMVDGAIGQFLLLLLFFAQPIRKYTLALYNKCKRFGRTNLPDIQYIPNKIVEEKIAMERVEAFSDGVFAIVATLIILDICEDNIPSKDSVVNEGHSLASALHKDWAVYMAYFGTFITVGMLWFVHHSVCHFLVECNRSMSAFNTVSLAFIGGAPLAFKLTSMFAESDYGHNERIAIQFNCVILFVAGICQLMMFVTAIWKPHHLIHPSAGYHGKEHGYLVAKLCVYPVISLSIYFLSFQSDALSTDVFNITQIGIPVIFLLLRFAFYVVRKQRLKNVTEQDFPDAIINEEEQRECNDPILVNRTV